jgi:organic hydroperoxide reductase OsmC/OhrA
MKALYSTRATAHGGRAGRVRSDDGLLEHNLALPRA